MKTSHSLTIPRRNFLSTIGGLTAFSILGGAVPEVRAEPRKGRLKQSVCRGVFNGAKLDLEGMSREAARLGSWGIDLVGPSDFPVLKKYGLVPTMMNGASSIKSGRTNARCSPVKERKFKWFQYRV